MPGAPAHVGSGKLRWGRYSASYRARLLEAAKVLMLFLSDHGYGWDLISAGRSRDVDAALEAFVRNMHECGKASSLRIAKHAILYVQAARPRLKKTLKSAWNSIRIWEEQTPSSFRAPLPLSLLVALTCQCRAQAAREEKKGVKSLWLIFSVLINLGYFALLRPGELFKLKGNDVLLPNSISLGAPFAIVRLECPKNSRQMGRQQFAEVHHPDAINWMSWLVTVTKPSSPLWPSSPNRFRVMFRQLCAQLGLEGLKLSPASLRAGGATWMLDERIEVSRIRFSGRWSNLRSLEHYLQVARAQQITLSLGPLIILRIKKLIQQHAFMLTLPTFLAAQVPSEHLLPSHPLTVDDLSNVVAAVRSWGKLGQAV
eukprot:Skav212336  [mRNA]  locus=scaffold1488:19301:20410:+ [translate_table: standard]